MEKAMECGFIKFADDSSDEQQITLRADAAQSDLEQAGGLGQEMKFNKE